MGKEVIMSANNFPVSMQAIPVHEVVMQINAIQDLMHEVMKEGEHFGIIPGTPKKSLYKAGAEKIGLLFRLAPHYEVIVKDLSNNHLMVQITCTLQNINNGQVWGQGVGMCSTMEGKYRFRSGEGENTGTAVPKAYWDKRKINVKEAQALLGGPGFVAKKVDSSWFIFKKSDEKVEHDNPADFYNTVIKMAKKRAHVDAIITATAASDLFTQDVRDLEQEKDQTNGTGKVSE
jgi:hypothetical protein